MIRCFKGVDGTSSYYHCVERKVLFGGVLKSMALWFSLHYILNVQCDKAIHEVPLCFQDFVLGFPASKVSTYLTVANDVQPFTPAKLSFICISSHITKSLTSSSDIHALTMCNVQRLVPLCVAFAMLLL